MSQSNIQWTDFVWNPVTGCTKKSQGCKNCYAKEVHDKRHKAFLEGKLQNVKQYAVPFETVQLHPERLVDPMKWKKPRKIFVNSMSDLFHEEVDFWFILEVFDTMMRSPQHTFQVLTKRPERMVEFYNWLTEGEEIKIPKNIWIGVSVENQVAANERIPFLLKMPAAVRFLSCEPLLGPVDLNESLDFISKVQLRTFGNGIHWIIVGGESGHNARPMHPDWARSLRDQCHVEGVAFFFKQWGSWAPMDEIDPSGDSAKSRQYVCINHAGKTSLIANEVIGTEEDNCILYKFNKKEAGNLLDGKQYLEYPKTKI